MGDSDQQPWKTTSAILPGGIVNWPEAPMWEGHKFMGWNTARDGSGSAFTETTPVTDNLSVYAQWNSTWLSVKMLSDTLTLTPMKVGAYDERTDILAVVVSGFNNADDANNTRLELSPVDGLEFGVVSRFENGLKTFEVIVEYDGKTAFPEGLATLRLNLTKPEAYEYVDGATRIEIAIFDGQEKPRRIPVHRGNVEEFNAYANTSVGLKLHYRLIENVRLFPPSPGQLSNWTPIGGIVFDALELPEAFTGSFDGGGHTLSGLTLHAPNDDQANLQGLFALIGENAIIANLGLDDLHVAGNNWVGGLVGVNNGTVQNCHATGNVIGNQNVGGLIGVNKGEALNSYAQGIVEGDQVFVGGLVGQNVGSVRTSYATGKASGHGAVGGLVGMNNPLAKVENSYSTGDVDSSWGSAGGLVGQNNGSVENSYATGEVSGSSHGGGLVGANAEGGTVQKSVALNPRVIATHAIIPHVGRVVGVNTHEDADSLKNNHARNDMNIFYGFDEEAKELEGNGNESGSVDGRSVSAGDTSFSHYNSDFFWQLLGWNFISDWQWGPNNLPILKGVGGKQNHKVP